MKQFDCFRLDTSNQCLWRGGAQISLPPKPYAVLRYLVENPGRLISHDELLDALWPETYVQPQVLRTYMLELRKVLGDDAGQPRFIQTLSKRGYSFVAPVIEEEGMRPYSAAGDASPDGTPATIAGREDELAWLTKKVQSLASRERRVVFVSGEAGIGKTALVDTFGRQLHTSGTRVGRGQCLQGVGGQEPYYPVMEALSRLCTTQHGEAVRKTLARMAPAWLAPGCGPERAQRAGVRGTGTQPMAEERAAGERSLGDVCGALEELAAEKPLFLIFEDLDGADDSTLNLISALARRRAPAKLMLVATYRPPKVSTEHSLKALRQDLLMRPSGLAPFVYRRAEGNPLFVIALVEHLIAQEVLVRQGKDGAAEWLQRGPFKEMESGVPDKLAQMIELEIERLSPDEQHMLEAGSVMDVAFPAWAVAAALEKDAAETEETCDELARRLYFVKRAGQDELPDGTRSAFYVFAHGLYREVLYQRQTEARRVRRHARIADRLGELFSGREASVARERALHYEAAGEWRRAAAALHEAARHALERRSPGDAIELLERALRASENLGDNGRHPEAHEIERELNVAREALIQATT